MSGESVFAILRSSFRTFHPDVIFDVGSNRGQSIDAFSRNFPEAAIFAFEPVNATYAYLVDRTANMAKVSTFNVALSDRTGVATMESRGRSTNNAIVSVQSKGGKYQRVETLSGTEFCAAQDIRHIHYLKIDTEGHDLNVLIGFAGMLANSQISFFEAEVGMTPLNLKHVGFAEVDIFARAFGYRLVHISEQVLDVAFSGLPHLRRVNVLYASMPTIESFRRESP